jgi:hypothetical protein
VQHSTQLVRPVSLTDRRKARHEPSRARLSGGRLHELLAPDAAVPAERAEFLPAVLADGSARSGSTRATSREVTDEDIAGIFTRSLSLW